jgi:hypothetical protein
MGQAKRCVFFYLLVRWSTLFSQFRGLLFHFIFNFVFQCSLNQTRSHFQDESHSKTNNRHNVLHLLGSSPTKFHFFNDPSRSRIESKRRKRLDLLRQAYIIVFVSSLLYPRVAFVAFQSQKNSYQTQTHTHKKKAGIRRTEEMYEPIAGKDIICQ